MGGLHDRQRLSRTNTSRCVIDSINFVYNALTLTHFQYLRQKKPTGSGSCPPEVKCAHEIEDLINQCVSTCELSNSVTTTHFPILSGSFPAVCGHSGYGLLYGCYVPTNILLCLASSVDAQPLGFLQ
jgi:hypothetical protein